MGICRLLYRSQTSWDDFTNESLRELAKTSSKRNESLGITGLLLLSDETFLQVLEGPSSGVNQLYLSILKDPRHEEVTLMKFDPVSNRLFEDWAMNVIDLFDIPNGPREVLRAKYIENDGFIEVPEDADQAISLLLDAKAICLAESEREI